MIGDDRPLLVRLSVMGSIAPMRPNVRIALVVVGLAVITYGTADATGGWLGECF